MAEGASARNFQSDGNSNKRLRDHWYSEEVEGCRSLRLPPCARVERAPDEQSQGTQEVIPTIDEGRSGEHLHAALLVQRGRLPAGALQRGLACDPSVVLVPDPIVFTPWSVLLHRGEPCDSCQATSVDPAFGGSARVTCTTDRSGPHSSLWRCVSFFCPTPYHKSIGRVTLAMWWTARRATPSRRGATTMAAASEVTKPSRHLPFVLLGQ